MWHNDKGMQVLIDEVKRKYPGIVVYTIGDAAHAQRTSDHNPDSNGIVHAADFMIGKAFTKTAAELLARALTTQADKRAKYVIWNRRISTRTAGWKWVGYTGTNPHTDHVHVSVNSDHPNDTDPWNIGPDRPILVRGDRGDAVKTVQRAIGVRADGIFGPDTERAVIRYQKQHKLMADGIVGPATWAVIDG